jgi:hypothetical protein
LIVALMQQSQKRRSVPKRLDTNYSLALVTANWGRMQCCHRLADRYRQTKHGKPIARLAMGTQNRGELRKAAQLCQFMFLAIMGHRNDIDLKRRVQFMAQICPFIDGSKKVVTSVEGFGNFIFFIATN